MLNVRDQAVTIRTTKRNGLSHDHILKNSPDLDFDTFHLQGRKAWLDLRCRSTAGEFATANPEESRPDSRPAWAAEGSKTIEAAASLNFPLVFIRFQSMDFSSSPLLLTSAVLAWESAGSGGQISYLHPLLPSFHARDT